MADPNCILTIVQILENPKQIFLKDTIPVTEFRVQLPQFRNNIIIHLAFWGKFGQDILNFYNVNDYLIIEGYLSFKDNNLITKKIKITVLKVYPLFLNYNLRSSKI